MHLFHSTYKKWSLFLLAILIVLPVISYMGFSPILISIAYINVSLLIAFILPRKRNHGKQRQQAAVRVWAFSMAGIVVAGNLLAGYILGFGKSPYSHSLSGLLLNTLIIGSALIARENIRNDLIKSLAYDKQKVGLLFIVLVIILAEVPFTQIGAVKDTESLVSFLAVTLMPLIMQNITMTYLVIWSDSLAAIIYGGIIQMFYWYSPILPNLNWFQSIVVSVLIPAVLLFVYHEKYSILTGKVKKDEKEEHMVGNMLFIGGAVVFIWFVVGVFPYYPSAIATGSMRPGIQPGDVVIVSRIKDIEEINALKVGDIIQFKRGDILVNHRIVEIVDENGVKSYRTKGDNNNVEDQELVKMEEIKGIITYVVPKAGLPTIWLKGGLADLSKI